MDTAERYRARRKAEEAAGHEINHIGMPETDKGGMCDRHVCSCGWESTWYFDGSEYATDDWVKHIQQHGAEIDYPQSV